MLDKFLDSVVADLCRQELQTFAASAGLCTPGSSTFCGLTEMARDRHRGPATQLASIGLHRLKCTQVDSIGREAHPLPPPAEDPPPFEA
jgi:hypothetical protein